MGSVIESRIPGMPCCHLLPKRSNDMAVCRSVGYVAFLYIVVLLQVDDGNVEDLERFLLSIQDCISYIERCTAPGNDRNMECKHDRLEGFVEIIAAFSLVLANVQGFLEIKVLVDDLPHFLRELLNHIRYKNAASFQVSAKFRSVPYREKSSLGRPKYNITAERIDVLRSTGMQWAIIAKCSSVSARTLSRRRIEFGILDNSEVNEEELVWNVKDILRITPISKNPEALQRIDPVNHAIMHRYAIQ